jgi:hypothetical protein
MQYYYIIFFTKLHISKTIYKNDTNFWDEFFIIPILSLKKLPTKK